MGCVRSPSIRKARLLDIDDWRAKMGLGRKWSRPTYLWRAPSRNHSSCPGRHLLSDLARRVSAAAASVDATSFEKKSGKGGRWMPRAV